MVNFKVTRKQHVSLEGEFAAICTGYKGPINKYETVDGARTKVEIGFRIGFEADQGGSARLNVFLPQNDEQVTNFTERMDTVLRALGLENHIPKEGQEYDFNRMFKAMEGLECMIISLPGQSENEGGFNTRWNDVMSVKSKTPSGIN